MKRENCGRRSIPWMRFAIQVREFENRLEHAEGKANRGFEIRGLSPGADRCFADIGASDTITVEMAVRDGWSGEMGAP